MLNARDAFRLALTWAASRPAHLLLTASDERLAAQPAQRFALAWLDVMAVSLVWGVVLANVWGVAWKVFHDYEPLIMPAVATAALMLLWPFRRAAVAVAETAGGGSPAGRAVVAGVVVLTLTLALARLRGDTQRWEPQWAVRLWWLIPEYKLYRVLLLMPLWGGWAMLIATRFCRPAPDAEPQVAAMAAGCPPLAAAGCMAVPLVPSMVYFHYLGAGSQVLIPAATIAAAVLGGAALCRRAGGLRRSSLLAANMLTQLAFLLAYLAGR